MSDDYLDLDNVLFGDSDPPADGSFDPFLPGLGLDEQEDDGTNGYVDTTFISDGTDIVGGSDRTNAENRGGLKPDDEGLATRQGGTAFKVVGADEERERAATHSGYRHVRGVAADRTGSAGTREAGSAGAEGVANSISAAQQRIRALASVPITDDDRRAIADGAERQTHGVNKPKRTYQKQHIISPPEFQRCEFEATLLTCNSKVAGNWILQFSVPPSSKDSVFELADAYGLGLKITVERKRYDA